LFSNFLSYLLYRNLLTTRRRHGFELIIHFDDSQVLPVFPHNVTCSDTKSEGPTHTLPTTDPACLVLIVRSLIDRHLFPLRLQPAHCSTADLFVFEDLQTIKHMTGHSTAHNVFSHICIKTALHFIHKVYTYSDSTSMSLQKHESDRFWSSHFSSTSSILPQLELSYLTDAAEDQNLAKKLLATEFSLLFLLSFSPKSFPTLLLSLLSDLYLLLPVLLSTLPSLVFSNSLLIFFFRPPLLHPEVSPNLSAPFQSDSQSAVTLNRLH
jgi:hypothetical protein